MMCEEASKCRRETQETLCQDSMLKMTNKRLRKAACQALRDGQGSEAGSATTWKGHNEHLRARNAMKSLLSHRQCTRRRPCEKMCSAWSRLLRWI